MTGEEVTAFLGLVFALFAGVGTIIAWLLGRLDRAIDYQNKARHDLANQVHLSIDDVEERLNRQINDLRNTVNGRYYPGEE